MKKKRLLFLAVLLFGYSTVMGQHEDSVTLDVSFAGSDELKDFYRFEEINYLKFRILGKGLKGQYYILTSEEY